MYYNNLDDFVYDNHIKAPILKSEAFSLYKKEEKAPRFVCPKCYGALVKAEGEKIKRYFRHKHIKNDEECKNKTINKEEEEKIINYCNESIAHKKFKDEFLILKENKIKICLPEYIISLNDYNTSNNFEPINLINKENTFHKDRYRLVDSRDVYIIDIQSEKSQNTDDLKNKIIPDLVVTCQDVITNKILEYNIEIVVTHAVNSEKFEKIKANKKNCIQIYLNKFENFENLNKKGASRYIHTEEISVEKVYNFLYSKYKEKSEDYNRNYVLNNDKDYFAVSNDKIIIKNEGKCLHCDKHLFFDDKNKVFRHKDFKDFLYCSKDINKAKKKILNTIINNSGYIRDDSFNVKYENDTIKVYGNYFKEDIDINQIDMKKLYQQLEKSSLINFREILLLNERNKNLLRNVNFFYDYIKNIKNKSILLDYDRCVFCGGDKSHSQNCLLYKDEQTLKEYIDKDINTYLKRYYKDNIKILKDASIKYSEILTKIKFLFHQLGRSIDDSDIIIEENYYQDISKVKIKIDDEIIFLFNAYFNTNVDNDESKLIIKYSLLSEKEEIEMKSVIFIDNNFIENNKKIKEVIENLLIKNSKKLNQTNRIFKKYGVNLLKYGFIIEDNYIVLKPEGQRIKTCKIIFNRDSFKKEDVYNTSLLNIVYKIDNNYYINIKEKIYNNNLLQSYKFMYTLLNCGYLKGENFLLFKNKHISEIKFCNYVREENKCFFDIKIDKINHKLCLSNKELKNESSIYLNIKNIPLNWGIKNLLKNTKKIIKIDKIKKERISHFKYIEEKAKKDKIIKNEKIKNIKKHRKLYKNHYATNNYIFVNNIKRLIAPKIGKIFSIRDITDKIIKSNFTLLNKENFQSNLKILKIITKGKRILLIPKFDSDMSIEENIVLLMLKTYNNAEKEIIKEELNLASHVILYENIPYYYINEDIKINLNEDIHKNKENIKNLTNELVIMKTYSYIYISELINNDNYIEAKKVYNILPNKPNLLSYPFLNSKKYKKFEEIIQK